MSPVSSIVSDIQQIPHIFYIIPYFLFIARMLKLYKQNKEDRAFWAWGSINIINIIYHYLYFFRMSAFSTPWHCQHLGQPLTYSMCWINTVWMNEWMNEGRKVISHNFYFHQPSWKNCLSSLLSWSHISDSRLLSHVLIIYIFALVESLKILKENPIQSSCSYTINQTDS